MRLPLTWKSWSPKSRMKTSPEFKFFLFRVISSTTTFSYITVRGGGTWSCDTVMSAWCASDITIAVATYPQALKVKQSWLILLWLNMLEATLGTKTVDETADFQKIKGPHTIFLASYTGLPWQIVFTVVDPCRSPFCSYGCKTKLRGGAWV